MTLPVLLAHVAARWAVTRTPTHGWVPDESETEMTEQIYTRKDMARAWEEGHQAGIITAVLKAFYMVEHEPWNPYEQEEA